MTDAGKAALYLRSIREELRLKQLQPTQIAVDNRGACQLTNTQQPSKRTRHIDMRDFCIVQWTEDQFINFTDIPGQYNVSDSMSKPTGRIKFYKQMDIMMSRRRPSYVPISPLPIDPSYRPTESQLTISHHDDLKSIPCPSSPISVIFSTCCPSEFLSITDVDNLLDYIDSLESEISTLQVWGGERDD